MRYYNIFLAAAAFCGGVLVERFYLSEQPRTDLAAAVAPQKEQRSPSSEHLASHQESSPCATRDRLPEPGALVVPSASLERPSKFQADYAAVLRELGLSEQEVYESIVNFRSPLQVSTDDEPKNNAAESEFERSPQELKDEYEKVLLELELSPGDAAQTAETFLENFSHEGEMEEDQLQKAAYEKVLNELHPLNESSGETH